MFLKAIKKAVLPVLIGSLLTGPGCRITYGYVGIPGEQFMSMRGKIAGIRLFFSRKTIARKKIPETILRIRIRSRKTPRPRSQPPTTPSSRPLPRFSWKPPPAP